MVITYLYKPADGFSPIGRFIGLDVQVLAPLANFTNLHTHLFRDERIGLALIYNTIELFLEVLFHSSPIGRNTRDRTIARLYNSLSRILFARLAFGKLPFSLSACLNLTCKQPVQHWNAQTPRHIT